MRVRISGVVLESVVRRLGQDPSKQFVFTELQVQIARAAIVPVRLTNDFAGNAVREGDVVDLACEVDAFVRNGSTTAQLSLSAVGDYDAAWFESQQPHAPSLASAG